MNRNPISPHNSARYRLQFQGRLCADWSDWLADVEVSIDGGGQSVVTVITGAARNQASLFGLMSHARDLGARLISVKRIS